MKSPWNKRVLDVYPSLILLTLLTGSAVAFVSILIFQFDPWEAIAATLLVMAIAIGLISLLYALFKLSAGWFRRTTMDRIIIGHIANVVRQKLPLAQGLTLAAASERGMARSCLLRIARPLAAGYALSDAIRIGWSDCPGLVLSMMLAGERAGQVSMAAEQAEQYVLQKNRGSGGMDLPVIPYAIVVISATFLVTAGVMVAVVPKFKEIFKDFDARMPRSTLVLIDVSEWFAQFGAPLLFLVLVGMGAGIYLWFRPRRVPDPRFTTYMADWLRWHTPGLRRLEWMRGLAVSLRTMGIGIRAGLDIPEAARLAATVDVNVELRSRLERFGDLLESGVEIREAANRSGLGRVAGLALASGQRGGDMAAAIRYAADYHDALMSRSWMVIRSLAWPITTVAMGILVAFVVRSLFEPLISLIDRTGGWLR